MYSEFFYPSVVFFAFLLQQNPSDTTAGTTRQHSVFAGLSCTWCSAAFKCPWPLTPSSTLPVIAVSGWQQGTLGQGSDLSCLHYLHGCLYYLHSSLIIWEPWDRLGRGSVSLLVMGCCCWAGGHWQLKLLHWMQPCTAHPAAGVKQGLLPALGSVWGWRLQGCNFHWSQNLVLPSLWSYPGSITCFWLGLFRGDELYSWGLQRNQWFWSLGQIKMQPTKDYWGSVPH